MNKYYILVVLLLLLSSSIKDFCAQNMQQIDSLIIELNKAENALDRMNSCIDISELYKYGNLDSAFYYTNIALLYPQQTGIAKYIGHPNYIFGSLYLQQDFLDTAQAHLARVWKYI